jgi:pimeloyl-ACP methyl ester carboxylesterase
MGRRPAALAPLACHDGAVDNPPSIHGREANLRGIRVSRSRAFVAAGAFAAILAASVRAQPPATAPKTTELGRGPAIVFVHGLGATRSDWMPTARKLIGRHRVVLVDLPGHGDTPLPDPFSFATVGAALDQVLARQSPDSTIVVAHQMGGRAALAALAAHPGRAKGLILLDVPVGVPAQIDDQQKKGFLEFMDSNYEAVTKMMFSGLGRDSTQSAAIYAVFAQTPPATVKAFIREGFYSDGNRDARALKVPVQMLATSRVWKSDQTAGAVLKLMGWEDTTLAVRRVPESGYWAMKDQADTLAAWIGEFAAVRIATAKR